MAGFAATGLGSGFEGLSVLMKPYSCGIAREITILEKCETV
jgi:hypothetical protein